MIYEVIKEIKNECANNQMRDVFVSSVETEDTEAYLRSVLVGTDITIDRTATRDGVIYDVVTDGLPQRFSFTED